MNLNDLTSYVTKPSKRLFALGAIIVAATLIPVWIVPYFVSQDGVVHVYNAYLMNQLIDGNPEFSRYLAINSLTVPNSTGHWLLVVLLRVLSPFTALKVIASLTFASLAASIVWLWIKSRAAAPGAELGILTGAAFAFNWMWFVGFYNFTIGVTGFVCSIVLFFIWRDNLNSVRAICLSLVLVVVYLSHLVPFVMSVSSLFFLTAYTFGGRRIRGLTLMACACLPSLALAIIYRISVGVSEPFSPAWRALHGWSIIALINQLRSVDPFVLISRTSLPLIDIRSMMFALFAPTFWIGVILLLLIWPHVRQLWDTKFADRVSTAMLLLLFGWTAFAIVGPDDFGFANGGILRDRVMICGLVFAIPLAQVPATRSLRAFVVGVLAVIVAFQTATLWDYSVRTNAVVAGVLEASSVISDDDAVITISVVNDGMRFHSVPEPNLGTLFGIQRNTRIWDNYELFYTLFPIVARSADDRRIYSQVVISHAFKPNDPKENFEDTFGRLSELLEADHRRFSKVVLIGSDKRIEALLATWFDPEPVFANSEVRVFRHRG